MAKAALVSSCLLGLATRYDGTDNYNQAVIDYANLILYFKSDER
jgi:uncharacterized protein YbbK (DUF523 family)